MAIIITFESWTTRHPWFLYARSHLVQVPFLLVDRSPCTDPYFDPFSPPGSARPVISGLCRRRKHYTVGQRFVFITRVDRRVLSQLGRLPPSAGPDPWYFGVAAVSVRSIHPSHQHAAASFQSGKYAAAPSPTDYPPNLAHNPYPGAAAARESCITHDVNATPPRPHTPATSTATMHRAHYNFYRTRQKGLPVAECQYERRGDRFALALDPQQAPVFEPRDWGNEQMNQFGRIIPDDVAETLTERIAKAGGTIAATPV
jgi:hypothetical protein